MSNEIYTKEAYDTATSYVIADRVSKSYHSEQASTNEGITPVLNDLSFGVAKGEIVTIFGPNGCGKTTLLMCIAGNIKPDQGTVVINGQHPGRARLGYVFQNYRDSLFPWQTNLQNLSFPLEIAGWPRSKSRRYAQSFLKELDWNIPPDSYPYQLSGGFQQLVAVARALIVEPEVLLMDEPFSSLDYETALSAHNALLNRWELLNFTVLLVSHDVDEAIYLADRIILLSKRPAQVLNILQCGLPRPRSLDMIMSSHFLDLKRQVLDTLKETFYSRHYRSLTVMGA
jgi:NitT/TauT family transport system ATP-binding protein